MICPIAVENLLDDINDGCQCVVENLDEGMSAQYELRNLCNAIISAILDFYDCIEEFESDS